MSSSGAESRRLPVLVNLTTGERYMLDCPSLSLGRAPDNQIILPEDGFASASHARVYFDQGRWLVEDLKSSNGTKVNDQIIAEPWPLAPNDIIRIGRTEFRIE
jgi:pSer/pThr/pTyr-binding forkhead associated (FHA) protein